MKLKLFSYASDTTFVHQLSGLTKLVCFLILTFTVMYTYDVRIMLAVMAFSCILFAVSHISFHQVKALFAYLFVFILLNSLIGYLFNPTYGCELYGTYHELFRFTPHYVVTTEQLFYQFSKMIKYMCIIPLGLIFFFTTHPSEFASSLNKAGVPYKGAFSVSLTLRYFPDIQRQFTDISQAQQARGLDMSRKEKLLTRVKNVLMVVSPLIFSTLDRVEYISNAMELRGFGKHKTRTWYVYKKLSRNDYISIIVCLLFAALTAYVAIYINHSRFYNPFI